MGRLEDKVRWVGWGKGRDNAFYSYSSGSGEGQWGGEEGGEGGEGAKKGGEERGLGVGGRRRGPQRFSGYCLLDCCGVLQSHLPLSSAPLTTCWSVPALTQVRSLGSCTPR